MADRETGREALDLLLENRRAFLAYLTRRVGNRALAEDLLQEAFAKALARPEQVPDGEALVPWFYRTLRNAAIDRFRRQGAADRALEAFARELETAETVPDEARFEVCQCISRLATTLKPDYAEALQAIEVEGLPVKAYAERQGLTAGKCRGARVPGARSAQAAGGRVVRRLRRARLPELHLPGGGVIRRAPLRHTSDGRQTAAHGSGAGRRRSRLRDDGGPGHREVLHRARRDALLLLLRRLPGEVPGGAGEVPRPCT